MSDQNPIAGKIRIAALSVLLAAVCVFVVLLKARIIQISMPSFLVLTFMAVAAIYCLYQAVIGLKTGRINLINSPSAAAIPGKFMKFDGSRKNIPALRDKEPFEYWLWIFIYCGGFVASLVASIAAALSIVL